jgi:type II secretory pathway pseudopilin PulG
MYCAWCGAPVATVSYAPCARCGRSTNGAQTAPPAASGGTNIVVVIVALIVGGLFVIAIAGILAAIAIPNFLTAMQRSKQKRTMADIRSIAAAVEAYGADNNAYPQAASIETLEPLVRPKYIAAMPNKDGWDHPMKYSCYETKDGHCSGYVLGSAGKDGMFEHSNLREYVDSPTGATTSFNADVIFAIGSFIQYPEGAQH